MKKILIAAVMLGALPLVACGPKTDAAKNVESAADNSGDALDNQAADVRSDAANTAATIENKADVKADALENRADAVRDAGANTAAAIDKKKGK